MILKQLWGTVNRVVVPTHVSDFGIQGTWTVANFLNARRFTQASYVNSVRKFEFPEAVGRHMVEQRVGPR
jgi:hypothetical protein